MFKKICGFVLCLIIVLGVAVNYACTNNISGTTTYNIECEYSEGCLTGKENVVFINNTETEIKEVKFNLYANAFREDAIYSPINRQYKSKAYYNGSSYGGMEIIKVYNNSEKDLVFSICGKDQNILAVELLEGIFPEESATINIEYKITLANVLGRTGITKKSVNLANFYPIICGIEGNSFYECEYYANGDPYFSDCANYNVKFTCKDTYIVASSGKLVKSLAENGTITNEYTITSARSFCLAISENFESITQTYNNIEITYYFYDDKTPEKSLTTAVNSIKLFSEKFGDYPYSTYSVVQTGFINGGMEFPALVYISDDLEDSAYLEVIAHETAHQWWQSVVGTNEIEYGFLDEGLAEYSVVIFYENNPDMGLTRENLLLSSEKSYKMFCTVSDKLFNKVNTSMERSLKEYASEYEYVNIAYVKPCIMYDTIRKTMGDDKFFKTLNSFYNTYKFKNVIPDELIEQFENKSLGAGKILRSFIEGKEII